MRILSAALIAAFFAAGTVAAYAQDAAPAPKVKCGKFKTQADCAAPDCKWKADKTDATKGKCSKAKKAK